MLLAVTIADAGQGDDSVADDIDLAGQNNSDPMQAGLVFVEMLLSFEHSDRSADSSAVRLVESEMNLSEADAADFVYLLATTSQMVRNDLAGIDEMVACERDADWTAEDPAYPLLDAIGRASANVGMRHLHLLNEDVGPEIAASLLQWLERQSSVSSDHTLRAKESLRRRGITQASVIERLCGDSQNESQ